MKALGQIILCASIALITFSAHTGTNTAGITPAEPIVSNMLAAIDNAKTLKFTLKTWERFEDEMVYNEVEAKLQVSPHKLYMKTTGGPKKGAEILYIEGKYDGKAYVYPGKFPYINLKLDPYGGLMREDQHHTVLSAGFGTLSKLIKNAKERAGEQFDEVFSITEELVWDNKQCYKLVLDDPTYELISYTVKEGEDLDDIAAKLSIPAYRIIELNDKVKDFDDVDGGDVITISSSYSKKTVLYIDKSSMLPLAQYIYDEEGLYEKYEFYNVKVNPVIKDEEFSEDYSDYKF